ncbi:TRAF-interacting protein with FHA domain-containing protein A [Hypomesus transpacificus]|uniref:TRAF-interacting protein with FHA domain-containing protein A n=1 Tax=Hypomesus transpacificus TaxID=137520 RepID=UPI001F078CB3|nr:TRAF-interacting protein with FHA domain-containing protein A [Hypomesus transpacificus]
MEGMQNVETEERMTCLQVQFYHPQQASRGLYRHLPLDCSSKHQAEDPLRLGRDQKVCKYILDDPRVSRKQLSLQAYRTAQSPDLLFTVQNLSQKGHLMVNGSELDYLERAELLAKALLRFGDYEILICREPGEAKGSFEVEFGVLTVPPSREMGLGVSNMAPVMDTGLGHDVSHGFPAELISTHAPLECDETYIYQS